MKKKKPTRIEVRLPALVDRRRKPRPERESARQRALARARRKRST